MLRSLAPQIPIGGIGNEEDVMGCCDSTGTCTTTGATTAIAEGREFAVEGMTCQSCATRVTTAVEAIPGVTAATVDLAARRLTVAGPASATAIEAAVSAAGYTIRS
ncbi:MAG: heavy-metal-associated domain-containing protein [Hamadaea sp.]|nr:heavy-metal-associated domain-containing protein [Hamadaea sp.]